MRRRDIPAALFGSVTGTLVPGTGAAQSSPPPTYPRTEEETRANVVASNEAFPPGNVRRYGAGDGRNADEVAFRNACAANDCVFVPRGQYVFNSQLDIDRSNITIIGESAGPQAVSIRLAPGAGQGAAAFRWGKWTSDVCISNLAIVLKNAGSAQIGIRFAEARRVRLSNCYIEGPSAKQNDTTAVQFDGTGTFTGDVDVENCYFVAHRYGVDLQRTCTTVRILNCEMYGINHSPGSVGVKIASLCAGVLVSGNSFEGWSVGVYTEGCYIKQIGNYFEDNTHHWQWVRGAGRARIWNSSFGDVCLSGGPPVFPNNDIDSCIVFGQSGSFVDNGYIEAARGFRERRRPFNMGEWTHPPFSSDTFSASGSMIWIVRRENVETFAYTIIGKTMIVSWRIAGSSIAGRSDCALRLALPEGCKPSRNLRVPVSVATGGQSRIGIAEVRQNESQVHIYPTPDREASYAAGPVELDGQISFEIV
jgi:hypothetical protein